MIRLAISVEGQTEEGFVNRSLAPHLQCRDVDATPILIGRARRRTQGGGNVSVDSLVTDMIRAAFDTPEDINDSPKTAPSKRILKLFPGYRKVRHGPKLALEIGLDRIRSECPRFDAWLRRLESLGFPAGAGVR